MIKFFVIGLITGFALEVLIAIIIGIFHSSDNDQADPSMYD